MCRSSRSTRPRPPGARGCSRRRSHRGSLRHRPGGWHQDAGRSCSSQREQVLGVAALGRPAWCILPTREAGLGTEPAPRSERVASTRSRRTRPFRDSSSGRCRGTCLNKCTALSGLALRGGGIMSPVGSGSRLTATGRPTARAKERRSLTSGSHGKLHAPPPDQAPSMRLRTIKSAPWHAINSALWTPSTRPGAAAIPRRPSCGPRPRAPAAVQFTTGQRDQLRSGKVQDAPSALSRLQSSRTGRSPAIRGSLQRPDTRRCDAKSSRRSPLDL